MATLYAPSLLAPQVLAPSSAEHHALTFSTLSPIRVAPGGRYFETFEGADFPLIGFNDAIMWPSLSGFYKNRDRDGARAYLRNLADHGVNLLRLMMEYAHDDRYYFQRADGSFNPHLVAMWDEIFAACEEYGLRTLLTQWDTYWMARRWDHHPYNTQNGGPASEPSSFFRDERVLAAVIERFRFQIERWGQTGVIAAWDLWNEIDPHWGGTPQEQLEVIGALSDAVRAVEEEVCGFTRPQTTSIFGPEPNEHYEELIFRHPKLDFATTHIYQGAIDNPQNTVTPAITMASWTRHALERVPANRPYTDSEHAPIHLFNDLRRMMPEEMDDEHERHIMWAHLACGGAGSGMRWPARHPHVLTPGTLRSLRSMADFCKLMDWRHFAPHDAVNEMKLQVAGTLCFGVHDETQAVLWLLRGKPRRNPRGMLPIREPLRDVSLELQGLQAGDYEAILWDTSRGCEVGRLHESVLGDGVLRLMLPELGNDLALAIRRSS